MKTLICSQNPPLFVPSSSPWNPKSPIFLHKNMQKLTRHDSKSWKLHANAKGFGSTSASVKADSAINKKAETKKGNDDDEIPQVVHERIIARILVSVGAPMATGLALLHIMDVMKEQNLWDVPTWVPFLTTFITFGASALGIAYGALSASLDPERKGSVLGFEEVQKNWVEMWSEEVD